MHAHVCKEERDLFFVLFLNICMSIFKLPKPSLPASPPLFSNPETVSSYIPNPVFPPSEAMSKTHLVHKGSVNT